MDITKVISQLVAATKATRFLDSQIAQTIGWTKDYGPERNDGKPQIFWFPPGSTSHGRFPYYTSNLQDTYELVVAVAPNAAVAFSWTDTGFQAVIEGMEPCNGASAPISLCIAALRYLEKSNWTDSLHSENKLPLTT